MDMQMRPFEPPDRMVSVTRLDQPVKLTGIVTNVLEHPREGMILEDHVVNFITHEQAACREHAGNHAGAGPGHSRDDDRPLFAGLLEIEILLAHYEHAVVLQVHR